MVSGSQKIILSNSSFGHTNPMAAGSTGHQSVLDGLSMISIKLASGNVEVVKSLTSEGLSLNQRLDLIKRINSNLGEEIFEFSTCNRVLYVGFSTTCDLLEESILEAFGLEEAPFKKYSGMSVWRNLVKICSGLDSFMLGELQVMAQFRDSIAWHKKNGLLSVHKGTFFDHIIAANRTIRKEFGFTNTTESMLNLATTSLEKILSENVDVSPVVLGFGDMGSKAISALLELEQSNVTVVSRSIEKCQSKYPELVKKVDLISFEEWHSSANKTKLVISTIRAETPVYNQNTPLPVDEDAVVMDFSWPPSIDSSILANESNYFGMQHWIRESRQYGKEWDYTSTIKKSEVAISDVESKFMSALTDRNEAMFRSRMYKLLEELSLEWLSNDSVMSTEEAQIQPFSREIATWICNKKGGFSIDEIGDMIFQTKRELNQTLLQKVAHDVQQLVYGLSTKTTA